MTCIYTYKINVDPNFFPCSDIAHDSCLGYTFRFVLAVKAIPSWQLQKRLRLLATKAVKSNDITTGQCSGAKGGIRLV